MAAAAPAGPPPTTSTSKASLPLIFSASRAAAPVSSLLRICSTVMRPWPNGSPFSRMVGTAMTWRCSTSSLNSAPSMATWLMAGFRAAMVFSAWTTSGQFWHDCEK